MEEKNRIKDAAEKYFIIFLHGIIRGLQESIVEVDQEKCPFLSKMIFDFRQEEIVWGLNKINSLRLDRELTQDEIDIYCKILFETLGEHGKCIDKIQKEMLNQKSKQKSTNLLEKLLSYHQELYDMALKNLKSYEDL